YETGEDAKLRHRSLARDYAQRVRHHSLRYAFGHLPFEDSPSYTYHLHMLTQYHLHMELAELSSSITHKQLRQVKTRAREQATQEILPIIFKDLFGDDD